MTTSQIWSSSTANIQASKARLSQLTAQSSSGLLVAKPSDDPVAAASILKVLNQQSANAQYTTNIADGLTWLSTADSTMTSSENLVRQAKDLAIQAGNSGTATPASRNAIATQLEGIRDDLLSAANTKVNGRSIFAGTSDAAAAFTAAGVFAGSTTTTSTTNGTTTTSTVTGSVQRRIGSEPTDLVTVSADGSAAFGAGTTASPSVFQQIQGVIDALRSPGYDTDTPDPVTGRTPKEAVTAGIDLLNTALTNLSAQHAVLGANYARMTSAKTQNATTATALETQRSGLQDADTTKTLLDLKTQELAYQTALQVTAQVIQPTLMSFLS
ncbi:flagellar hook-associated protein FlgL [Amnibacterium kyonggiense]|uniref:flagellar hook-associated protein FlgL n=1 Tax=Amnibacterium kyonggiense TaxID=595671 RepID=UPI0013C32945|nr:flagellar hook-associated protein FlgL [Amnibacterium kyonggiense]